MKSTIREMKISPEEFKGRFKQAKERFSNDEARIIDMTKSEEDKGKRLRKSEQSLRHPWDEND